MNATVTREVVNGFEVLVLANSRVRASVVPSLGGRMWELLDRSRERQWIWHRDDCPLAASSCLSCRVHQEKVTPCASNTSKPSRVRTHRLLIGRDLALKC